MNLSHALLLIREIFRARELRRAHYTYGLEVDAQENVCGYVIFGPNGERLDPGAVCALLERRSLDG
jgi:hypothetical protein